MKRPLPINSMTLQLLHSEFPNIWGKFDFLFISKRKEEGSHCRCLSWRGSGKNDPNIRRHQKIWCSSFIFSLILYWLVRTPVMVSYVKEFIGKGPHLFYNHLFGSNPPPPPPSSTDTWKLLLPSLSLSISSLCEAELLGQMSTVPWGWSQIIRQKTVRYSSLHPHSIVS